MNRIPDPRRTGLPDAASWRYVQPIAALVLGALLFTTATGLSGTASDWRGHVLPSLANVPGWTVFALYAAAVPASRRQLAGLTLAWLIALCGADLLIVPDRSVLLIGFLPFASAATVLALDVARARDPDALRRAWALVAASAVLPAAMIVKERALSGAIAVLPTVYDLRLAQVDGAFGPQVASAIATALATCPPFELAVRLVYIAMPLAIAVAAGVEARAADRSGLGLLPVFVIVGLLGYLCYALVPAIGPLAYFGTEFSRLHVEMADFARRAIVDDDPSHLRNAMPSLHTSAALLIWLMSRRWSALAQCCAGGLLVLTLVATLGLGEHYMPDLLVAAPFVLLVRGLASTDVPWPAPARWRAILAGFLLVAFWLAFFRSTTPTDLPPWTILAALAAGALAAWRLERTLFRAENELCRQTEACDAEGTFDAGFAAGLDPLTRQAGTGAGHDADPTGRMKIGAGSAYRNPA